VTAFYTPGNISDARIREAALRYGVFLAGSWGSLKGKVLRIGNGTVYVERKSFKLIHRENILKRFKVMEN